MIYIIAIAGLLFWFTTIGFAYVIGLGNGMESATNVYQDTIKYHKLAIETYKKIVMEQAQTISFWKETIDAIASHQPVLPDGKGRKP